MGKKTIYSCRKLPSNAKDAKFINFHDYLGLFIRLEALEQLKTECCKFVEDVRTQEDLTDEEDEENSLVGTNVMQYCSSYLSDISREVPYEVTKKFERVLEAEKLDDSDDEFGEEGDASKKKNSVSEFQGQRIFVDLTIDDGEDEGFEVNGNDFEAGDDLQSFDSDVTNDFIVQAEKNDIENSVRHTEMTFGDKNRSVDLLTVHDFPSFAAPMHIEIFDGFIKDPDSECNASIRRNSNDNQDNGKMFEDIGTQNSVCGENSKENPDDNEKPLESKDVLLDNEVSENVDLLQPLKSPTGEMETEDKISDDVNLISMELEENSMDFLNVSPQTTKENQNVPKNSLTDHVARYSTHLSVIVEDSNESMIGDTPFEVLEKNLELTEDTPISSLLEKQYEKFLTSDPRPKRKPYISLLKTSDRINPQHITNITTGSDRLCNFTANISKKSILDHNQHRPITSSNVIDIACLRKNVDNPIFTSKKLSPNLTTQIPSTSKVPSIKQFETAKNSKCASKNFSSHTQNFFDTPPKNIDIDIPHNSPKRSSKNSSSHHNENVTQKGGLNSKKTCSSHTQVDAFKFKDTSKKLLNQTQQFPSPDIIDEPANTHSSKASPNHTQHSPKFDIFKFKETSQTSSQTQQFDIETPQILTRTAKKASAQSVSETINEARTPQNVSNHNKRFASIHIEADETIDTKSENMDLKNDSKPPSQSRNFSNTAVTSDDVTKKVSNQFPNTKKLESSKQTSSSHAQSLTSSVIDVDETQSEDGIESILKKLSQNFAGSSRVIDVDAPQNVEHPSNQSSQPEYLTTSDIIDVDDTKRNASNKVHEPSKKSNHIKNDSQDGLKYTSKVSSSSKPSTDVIDVDEPQDNRKCAPKMSQQLSGSPDINKSGSKNISRHPDHSPSTSVIDVDDLPNEDEKSRAQLPSTSDIIDVDSDDKLQIENSSQDSQSTDVIEIDKPQNSAGSKVSCAELGSAGGESHRGTKNFRNPERLSSTEVIDIDDPQNLKYSQVLNLKVSQNESVRPEAIVSPSVRNERRPFIQIRSIETLTSRASDVTHAESDETVRNPSIHVRSIESLRAPEAVERQSDFEEGHETQRPLIHVRTMESLNSELTIREAADLEEVNIREETDREIVLEIGNTEYITSTSPRLSLDETRISELSQESVEIPILMVRNIESLTVENIYNEPGASGSSFENQTVPEDLSLRLGTNQALLVVERVESVSSEADYDTVEDTTDFDNLDRRDEDTSLLENDIPLLIDREMNDSQTSEGDFLEDSPKSVEIEPRPLIKLRTIESLTAPSEPEGGASNNFEPANETRPLIKIRRIESLTANPPDEESENYETAQDLSTHRSENDHRPVIKIRTIESLTSNDPQASTSGLTPNEIAGGSSNRGTHQKPLINIRKIEYLTSDSERLDIPKLFTDSRPGSAFGKGKSPNLESNWIRIRQIETLTSKEVISNDSEGGAPVPWGYCQNERTTIAETETNDERWVMKERVESFSRQADSHEEAENLSTRDNCRDAHNSAFKMDIDEPVDLDDKNVSEILNTSNQLSSDIEKPEEESKLNLLESGLENDTSLSNKTQGASGSAVPFSVVLAMFKLINMTITSKKNVAKTPPESNSGSSQRNKDESLTNSETDDIIKSPPLKFQNKNTLESAEPPKTQSNTLKDEIPISRDKKSISKSTGEQKSLYSLYLSKIGSGIDKHKDVPEKYTPQKDTNLLKKSSINVENFSKETNVHVSSVGTESSTNASLSTNSSLPSTNQAHLNQQRAGSKSNTRKKRPFSSIVPENEQISEKLSKTEHISSLEITREPTTVSEKPPNPEPTSTNTSLIQITDSKLNSEQIEPNFKKKSKDIPKKVETEHVDSGEMVDVKSKSEDIYEAPIALKEHNYAAIPGRKLKKPSTELKDCNKIIILSSEDVMNAHKATGSDVGARNSETNESPSCASPAQETSIRAVFPNETTSTLDNVELNKVPDDQNQHSDFNRDDKSQLLTSKSNSKPPENDTSQNPLKILDRSRQTSNSDQNLLMGRSSKKRACASKSFELKKLKVRLQKIDYLIVKLQKQNTINIDEAGTLINGQKYRATGSTSTDEVVDGSESHEQQLVVARNIEPPFTGSSINPQDAKKPSQRQKDQVINLTSTNRVDDNSEPHEKQLVVARNIQAPLTGSQKESSIKTQEASELLHNQNDHDVNPVSVNRVDDSKSHEKQLIATRNIEPLVTEVQNESSINSQEAVKPLHKQKDRENNSASSSQVDDDSKLYEKQLQTRDIESPFTELQNERTTNFCEASKSLNSQEINPTLTNRVVDTKLHEKQLIEARNIETSFTESLQKQKDQEIYLASTSRVDNSKTNEKQLQVRNIEPCSTDSINFQETSKFVRRRNSSTSTNRVDEDSKLHKKHLIGAQNIEACLTEPQKENLVKGQEINPTSTNRVDDDSESYKKQLVVDQNIEALSIALQKGSWINVKKVSKSLQGQKDQEINSASTNQVGDDSKLHEKQLVWVGNIEINPASTNQVGDDGKLHKKQLVVARNIETVTEVQHSISAQDLTEPLQTQIDKEMNAVLMNQEHDSKSHEKLSIAARNMEPYVTEVQNGSSINAQESSKPLYRQKDRENDAASRSRADDLKSHGKQLIETRNIKASFIELQCGSSNSQEASESLQRQKDRDIRSASTSQQTRNIEPPFTGFQKESSISFQGASKSLHSQKDQVNSDLKDRVNDSKLHEKQLIKAQTIEVLLNELQYGSSSSQEVSKSLHRQKDRETNSESKNRVDNVSKSHELARNIESSFTELGDGISNSQETSKSLHTQNDQEIVSTSKNQTDDVSKMHEKQLVWAQNIEPSLTVLRGRSSNSPKARKSLHRQKERENDTARSISKDKIGADSNSSRNIEPNAQNIEPSARNIEPGARNIEPSARNIEPSAQNSLQNERESLQVSDVQSTVPDIGKLESKTITNRSDDLENGSKAGTSIFNREKPTKTKDKSKHSKKKRSKQIFSAGDDTISNVESLENIKRNRVSESKKQLQTSLWSSYVLDDTTISEIKKSSEKNKKMNKLKSDSASTSSDTKTIKNKRKGKRNNVDEPKTKTTETRDLKTLNVFNADASPSLKDAGKNKRLRSENDEEDLNIKKLKISDDENSSSSSIHKDANEDLINPNIKIEDVTIQQLEEYASLEIKAENLSKCSSDSQEFCSLNITSSQFLPDVQVKSEENISEILRKYVSRVEVEDSSLSDETEQELFFSLEEK